MSITIPEEILEAAHIAPEELKLEIAVVLFRRGGLTLAQASRFCGADRVQFQRELAARQIPMNYGMDEFESDLDVIRQDAERG